MSSLSRLILVILLATASAGSLAAQSGRKIRGGRAAPAAPIQPSLNPEPEAPPVHLPSALLFLSESFRERQIQMLDSGSFRFADFPGKVVVINLWASWCGPCRREIPEYEKVRHAFADRDVEFIGLTTEDPRASAGRVRKFVREVKFGFRLGWADLITARTLMNGEKTIPQTLVIDAKGRVISHWSGFMPRHSGDRLTAAINQAIERSQ